MTLSLVNLRLTVTQAEALREAVIGRIDALNGEELSTRRPLDAALAYDRSAMRSIRDDLDLLLLHHPRKDQS